MSKDAFYFKHDSNAKDDPKCVLLIEDLGLEGYGIYWVLIETLRDQSNYKYPMCLVSALARRFNTSIEKIKDVILKYNLFAIEDDYFSSPALNDRMFEWDVKRSKAAIGGRASAAKRLNERSTNVEQTLNERSTNVQVIREEKRREEERREERNKEIIEEEEEKTVLVMDYDFKTCKLKEAHPHRQLIESGLRLFAFFRQRTQNNDLNSYTLIEWLRPVKVLQKNYNREQIEELVEYANADKFWGAIVLNTDSLQRNFEKIKAQFIKSLNEK